MRVRLIAPGNQAPPIARHLRTLQKFAGEVVSALRKAAAVAGPQKDWR